jgi:GNAT superfamily N-acetyltransferase
MMATEQQRIFEMEWANYAATREMAQVTPELELMLRDDVTITSSTAFPVPDTNHACLLRTTPQQANRLITEVIGYFQTRELPTTIYLSPVCSPADLPERLITSGFVEQKEQEAWMSLDDLPDYDIPELLPQIPVRTITPDEALTFAEVFMTAFGMPVDFAPAMAQLLAPSIGLDNIYHYLAFSDERPIGTCSLICYEQFGIVGSAGVVQARRGKGAATNLVAQAAREALDHGVQTLMLQTTAGTLLERFLRIKGFRRAFTRTCYVLEP